MSTDNVLMHNTDMEREGGRRDERWILQTRLFLDSKWGKQRRGLLSADEDDNSGRRGGYIGEGGGM